MDMQNEDLMELEKRAFGWDDEKHIKKYLSEDRAQNVMDFYFKRTGKVLNLEKPITYNEKLQWLKCFWRNSLPKMCADKLKAREIVKQMGFPELNIPLIGIWNDAHDINFEELPESFVLKTTHGSGFNLFVRNKSQLNINKVREVFNVLLRKHSYILNYEWVYEDIVPRIICEPILFVRDDEALDYKFFCFHGKAEYVHVLTATKKENEKNEPYNTLVDRDFNIIPVVYGYDMPFDLPKKPSKFEHMLKYAEALSKPFPHVRIDLYLSKDRIFFGEYTFFTGSGCDEFEPEEFNCKMGALLDLKKIPSQDIIIYKEKW